MAREAIQRPEVPAEEFLKDNNKVLLPKKSGVVICGILYVLANAVFFIAAFLAMPLFGEVVEFGRLQPAVSVFRELFPNFSFIFLAVMLLVTLVMYSKYVKKGYPTFLTLISLLYNDIACTVFALIYYSINLRQVYFTNAVVFIIPVMTIVLSSVFIIDDTYDIIRDKFEVPIKKKDKPKKKKKAKKGELKMAEVPAPTIATIQEITELHEKAAAKAAEIAIPSLKTTQGEDIDNV